MTIARNDSSQSITSTDSSINIPLPSTKDDYLEVRYVFSRSEDLIVRNTLKRLDPSLVYMKASDHRIVSFFLQYYHQLWYQFNENGEPGYYCLSVHEQWYLRL